MTLTPTQLQALVDKAERLNIRSSRGTYRNQEIKALALTLLTTQARLAEVEEALEGVANNWGCWCTDLWRATHDHVDDPDHSPACVAARQAVGHE